MAKTTTPAKPQRNEKVDSATILRAWVQCAQSGKATNEDVAEACGMKVATFNVRKSKIVAEYDKLRNGQGSPLPKLTSRGGKTSEFSNAVQDVLKLLQPQQDEQAPAANQETQAPQS